MEEVEGKQPSAFLQNFREHQSNKFCGHFEIGAAFEDDEVDELLLTASLITDFRSTRPLPQ